MAIRRFGQLKNEESGIRVRCSFKPVFGIDTGPPNASHASRPRRNPFTALDSHQRPQPKCPCRYRNNRFWNNGGTATGISVPSKPGTRRASGRIRAVILGFRAPPDAGRNSCLAPTPSHVDRLWADPAAPSIDP